MVRSCESIYLIFIYSFAINIVRIESWQVGILSYSHECPKMPLANFSARVYTKRPLFLLDLCRRYSN